MSTAALPPPKKKRKRGKGRGRGVDGTGDPVVAEAQVKVSVLAATAKQDTPPSRWQKLQKLQQKVRRVRDQGQVIRARGSDASGSRAENGTRGPVKDVEMVHIGPGTPAAISNVGCVDTSDNNGMAYQEAPATAKDPALDLTTNASHRARAVTPVLCLCFTCAALVMAYAALVVAIKFTQGDSLIALDCLRAGPFSIVLPLSFLFSFLIVSVICRPRTRSSASVRSRMVFAGANLFVACGVMIAAATIGYPQGLCDTSCMCGLCKDEVFMMVSEDRSQKGRNSACAPKGIRITTSTDVDGSCSGEGVETPEIYTARSPGMVSKMVLSDPNLGEADRYARSINLVSDLLEYQRTSIMKSSVTEEVAAVDGSCTEGPADLRDCPASLNRQVYVEDFLVLSMARSILPAIGDRIYRFCDKSESARTTCPNTICCRTCNTIKFAYNCAYKLDLNASDMVYDLIEAIEDFVQQLIGDGSDNILFSHASRLGLDEDIVAESLPAAAWVAESYMSLMNVSDFSWASCMATCVEECAPEAPWYGRPPECLATENRSWHVELGSNTVENRVISSQTNTSQPSRCECDARARAWSNTVLLWYSLALFLCAALIMSQARVALLVNSEEISCPCHRHDDSCTGRACCRQKLILSSVFSPLIVGCLIVELSFISAASSGASCANQGLVSVRWKLGEDRAVENHNFMFSFASLNVVALFIAMHAGILPIVLHVSGSGNSGSKDKKLKAEKKGPPGAFTPFSLCNRAYHAYGDLLSMKRGQYYVPARFFKDSVDMVIQTAQLVSFAHERDIVYILSMSALFLLKGISTPVPLIVGKRYPAHKQSVRLTLVLFDTLFDFGIFTIAIVYSERENFGNEYTFISILGVAHPAYFLARRLRSVSRYLKMWSNGLLQRVRSFKLKSLGTRVFSTGHDSGPNLDIEEKNSELRSAACHNRNNGSSMSNARQMDAGKRFVAQIDISRGMICWSFLIFAYCTLLGAVLLHMTFTGDAVCRSMLGNSLWDGAYPKHVIVKNEDNGQLRGDCNFLKINSIYSTASSSQPPLERLPNNLAKLRNLTSLVLVGHRIASDGIPASILMGTAMPNLTKLEFGEHSPARYALDLAGESGVHEFPEYVLQFMTELESLKLNGTSISCFPRYSRFKKLKQLRTLDLSGTQIRYLPPQVLFEHSRLDFVNLSGTPVWHSLDWSAHDLGNESARSNLQSAENWNGLAKTLPMIESLNISRNGLTNVDALDLRKLPSLKIFDVSHNPELTPPSSESFSWWLEFSEHATLGDRAEFIGLANVGLSPEHVRLSQGGMTCGELRWISETMTGDDRIDLSENSKFRSFHEWVGTTRSSSATEPTDYLMQCHKPPGSDSLFIDIAIFRLVLALLPNIISLSLIDIFQQRITDYSDVVSLRRFFASAAEKAPKLKSLQIRGMGVQSNFPREIGQLSNLQYLSLAETDFRFSTIPESVFANMTKLRGLDLTDCRLGGRIPRMVSALSMLRDLRMTGNFFDGVIPEGLYKLTKLSQLEVLKTPRLQPLSGHVSALKWLRELRVEASSSFDGSLPDEITALSALQSLTWTGVNGSGLIPTGISNLKRLRKISLRGCVRGEIPESISDLLKLTELELIDNLHLTGSIPFGISRLSKLQKLYLGSNNGLRGALPPGFENGMVNLESLSLPMSIVNASGLIGQETFRGMCNATAPESAGKGYEACCCEGSMCHERKVKYAKCGQAIKIDGYPEYPKYGK